MTIKSFLSRFRFAFSPYQPNAGFTYATTTLAAVAAVWLAFSGTGIAAMLPGVFLVLALSAALTSVHVAMTQEYDSFGRKAVGIQASKWVDAGESDEDIRQRRARLRALGAHGALTEAGVKPIEMTDYNVDGTAMIPGLGVDMNGNSLGFNSMGLGEPAPMDIATGMMLDTSSAYQSPIGMDMTSMGSSSNTSMGAGMSV